MNYKLMKANIDDVSILIDYKLKNIFDYAENLSLEEIKQIDDYKVICINDIKIGCLLVVNKDDGVLLNEIYLEEKYRNKGIGTSIIKKILSSYNIVYYGYIN